MTLDQIQQEAESFFGGKAPQEPVVITVTTPAPTQPALSAAEIHNLFNTLGTKLCLNYEVTPGQSQQIVKAVEAHCRGGAK